MTAAPLADAITAISPLDGDAIDGSRRATAARPRGKKAAVPVATYTGWQCPRCLNEYDEKDAVRHLSAHLNTADEQADELRKQLAAIGAEGVRTEFDELGNVLVYGPGNAADHPIVFLQFRNLVIDDAVQRAREKTHPLFRRGVRLDYNKTEAITVAPIYAAEDDGKGGKRHVLIGYRAIEGGHRARLGQEQDPEGFQACRIVTAETGIEDRKDESRLAREMTHSRSPFKAVHDWHSFYREGQPHVAAAADLLRRAGYTVGAGGSHAAGEIAAAGTLFRIIGLGSYGTPGFTPSKDPQEGARDLADVLQAIEGIAREAGEGNKRYSRMLLRVVYEIIDDNREEPGIEVGRLAEAMGTRPAEEWLKAGRDKSMNGTVYLRDLIVRAYNKGKPKSSASKVS
jgi:hypothetical protein